MNHNGGYTNLESRQGELLTKKMREELKNRLKSCWSRQKVVLSCKLPKGGPFVGIKLHGSGLSSISYCRMAAIDVEFSML